MCRDRLLSPAPPESETKGSSRPRSIPWLRSECGQRATRPPRLEVFRKSLEATNRVRIPVRRDRYVDFCGSYIDPGCIRLDTFQTGNCSTSAGAFVSHRLLSSATERAKSWGQVISQTGSTPCSGRRHQSFDHATWDHARKRALEKRQSVGRPASRPVAVRLYCYHHNLFIPVSTCPSRSVARNDLVVGVAEFVAARAVISVAQLVDRDRERSLGDVRHQLAPFDLVGRGHSLIAVAYGVADIAGDGGGATDMPDVAITLGRVGDAELLTGRVVARPEGLAHDQRLQLRIAQLGCTLCLEVGHRHAGGRVLARVGARGVPDRRRPGAFLSGERNHVGRGQAGLDCLDE